MSSVDGTCEYVLDPDDPETWGGEEGDEYYIDEKVLNEDGVWTCPHEAHETIVEQHEEKDLCLFHLPIGEKDDDRAVTAFLDALAEFADSDNPDMQRRKRQFVGARFGKFVLSDKTLSSIGDSPINMKHMRVNDGIYYENVDIENPFFMCGAKISGETYFQDVCFKKKADFSGSIFDSFTHYGDFEEQTKFNHVKCNSSMIFGSQFFDEVDFMSSVVSGGASFENCLFDDKADFSGFECKGARYDLAKFNDTLDFSHGHFDGGFRFRHVEVENKADFFSAKFHGTAIFQEAIFRGDVDFRAPQDSESTPNFQNDVNFTNSIFESSVDFRTLYSPNQYDDPLVVEETPNFEGDANFARIELRGEGNFAGMTFTEGVQITFTDASLVGVNMDRAMVKYADFRKANLTDANLSEASLLSTNLEKAVLNRADCFGTNFRGSAMYAALIGDAQINEETEFGDRCVYDPEFENEPTVNVDDDETGRLTKAAGQYRIIEQSAQNNAFPDMARYNFIRRKDIHRRQHEEEGQLRRWLQASLSRWVLLYGESHWRIILYSLGIILGFALLYPLGGWMKPEDGDPITYAQIAANPLEFANSVYYSTLTFTALGFGDFRPVGLGRALTTIETGLGAVLLALLVFVLGRRAAR